MVLPIIGATGQPRRFELPAHAREVTPIEIWSEQPVRGGGRGDRGGRSRGGAARRRSCAS